MIKACIKHVTAVTNHFWNRFYKEYLLSWRGKDHYHKNNTNKTQELKINNAVLTQDDEITPRNNWRRGKVELIVSKFVVQYYVYITKRKTLMFLLKRPVQKFIPFEIMNCVKEDNKDVLYLIANRPQ